jgi:hypothetical protein
MYSIIIKLLALLLLIKVSPAFGMTDTPGESSAGNAETQVSTENIPLGRIDPKIARIAYSGEEKFIYDI